MSRLFAIHVPPAVVDYLGLDELRAEGSTTAVVNYIGKRAVITGSLSDFQSILRDLHDIAERRFFDAATPGTRRSARVAIERINEGLK